MGSWSAITLVLPFIAVLLASGAWAARRFAAFEQLPGHFDFKGRASRLTPRNVMVWMLPGLFSVMLSVSAAAMAAIPRAYQNGDPSTGILIAGLSFLAAQGFVLWLTDRWARQQD